MASPTETETEDEELSETTNQHNEPDVAFSYNNNQTDESIEYAFNSSIADSTASKKQPARATKLKPHKCETCGKLIFRYLRMLCWMYIGNSIYVS
jgi:hypothetical protein